MADVYEQNLAQKSTLTTSDFIRVVGSDNVSYKQNMESVRDTLSFIPRYNASTVDYDTLYGDSPSFRTYAIGHLAQHAPASAWFFLASYRAENSYITQVAYGMTTSDIYTRRFQIGTTGTAWVKMPTRTEVDLLDKMCKRVTVSSSASAKVPCAGTANYATFTVSGFAQGIGSVMIAVVISRGSIQKVRDLTTNTDFSNSNLTFSYSSGELTISSTSASASLFTVVCG